MDARDSESNPFAARDYDPNPFASPEFSGASMQPVKAEMNEPLPCPKCRAVGATPVPYSAWRGRRATRAIEEVVCPQCKCEYNGETGVSYPPRKGVVFWFLLSLALFIAYFAVAVVIG